VQPGERADAAAIEGPTDAGNIGSGDEEPDTRAINGGRDGRRKGVAAK